MEIRRLVVRDAPGYRALMLDAYERHPDAFTASVAERGGLPLSWWEDRIDHEFVAGAWDGDALVGVAGLVAASRPKSRHKATLVGMYVDPGFLRQGIGRRLVEAVLAEAVARGSLRVVQLTVTDGNRSARALYERCGFTAFGVEPYAMRTDDGFRSKVHLWIDLATLAPSTAPKSEAASHA